MSHIKESEPLKEKRMKKQDEDAKCYAIDKNMLPSKFGYLFQAAKDSSYLPYMNIFLISAGLSPTQAGQVNGIRLLGAIVGSPLWGFFSDLKKCHRLIISFLCVSAMIGMSTQPFIAIALTGINKDECGVNVNASTNYTIESRNNTQVPGENSILFATMMVINIIASSFDGSTVGFIDAGVMQAINSQKKKTKFGLQRLFGAPGFGIGAFASSIAIQFLPKFGLPCYSAALFVYGFYTLCLTISSNILYRDLSINDTKREGDVKKLLHATLSKFHVLFFFFTVLVTGTVHGFYLSYLFILLKEIDSPGILMGLSILVAAVACIPVLYFLEKFIKIVGGTSNMILIGCFSWSIRLLITSYIQNPYLILPLQLFQTMGYALFIAAGVTHIKQIASHEIYSSMYGIFNGLFYGVGVIIANVTGGIILSKYGVRKLFMIASVISFIWSLFIVFYLSIQWYVRRRKANTANNMLNDLDREHEETDTL